MTNEEAFKVREQPVPTCPMIDDLIKMVNSIERQIKGYKTAEENELREMVDSVDTDISYFTDKLENIRRHVETIRAWGQDWKETTLNLSEHLSELKQKGLKNEC